ncbi:MAG: TIM barrel protein [Proteobacteria bacterium]|nr:TIM barrel protein [Pseudomonadota bacterium]
MARASPEGAPSRLLAVAARTLQGMPPLDRVAPVADAGFGAIGFFVEPDAWPDPLVRDVRALCGDQGLRILDVEAVRILAEPDLHTAARIIGIAGRLGTANVLVVAHHPGRAETVRQFREIAAMAGDAGLRAALEFMPFRPVATLRDAVQVVHDAGHPAGAVLVDSHHLSRSGGQPQDVRAVPAAMLPYVQICDVPAIPADPTPEAAWREARDSRRLPGAGGLPLRELIEALPPGCPLSAELIGPRVRQPYPDATSFLRAVARSLKPLIVR